MVLEARNRNFAQAVDEKHVLEKVGVTYHHVNVENLSENESFQELKRSMSITYQDTITVSLTAFPNYEEKLKTFFMEHLHPDDEIHLCLDGFGYYDVRDPQERWISVQVNKGDLITAPAGAYRFATDNRSIM
jgi:1,2-dihydroxy-3-keto-5-methylthiopentene dioxygenase